MFKLPQLQPHLTGTSGADGGKSLSKFNPFFSTSRGQRDAGLLAADLAGSGAMQSAPGFSISTKDWEAQAQDVVRELVSSDRYKSLALHAEVKLAEALERCGRLCPTVTTTNGEDQPSKLRTAVCCQLLGEFAELCGPFSGVLRTIRGELVKSVYSGHYSSDLGTLTFDQLPWFAVSERLEAEKVQLLDERSRFTAMLHQQQETITHIEMQLTTYQGAMQAAQLEAGRLQARLEGLLAGEEAARLEARTGREELKRLRKECMRLKDELEAARSSYRALKDKTDRECWEMQQQLEQQTGLLRVLERRADEAEAQAAIRLPPDSVAHLHDKVNQLEAREVHQRRQLEDLQAALAQAEAKLGTSTPRPSWRGLAKFGLHAAPGLSTQDLVTAAAQKLEQLASSFADSVDRAETLEMVLAEEATPTDIELAIATDASAYFITEATDKPSAVAEFSAEGLGMGVHVPRCLRRPAGRMVQGLRQLSQSHTEALVLQILEAKAIHDVVHPPQPLHAFLYTFFRQNLARQANGSAQYSHTPSSAALEIGGGPDQGPGARHYHITQRAYALYHALSTHGAASPLVRLFRHVLVGRLSDHAFGELRLLFTSLLAAARQVATTAAGKIQVMVPTPAMLEALQRLCASLPAYKAARLAEAYCQGVHAEVAPLSDLEVLLKPLTDGNNLAGQARLVKAVCQEADAEAAADPEPPALSTRLSVPRSPPSSVNTSPQARATLLSKPSSTPDKSVIDIMAPGWLSNVFVTALLNLYLEQQESAVAAVEAQLTSLVQAPQAPTAEPLNPKEAAILGGHSTATGIANALQLAGWPEGDASNAVIGLLGIPPNSVRHQAVKAALRLGQQRMWAGLALARLKQQQSMLRGTSAGFPDLPALLRAGGP